MPAPPSRGTGLSLPTWLQIHWRQLWGCMPKQHNYPKMQGTPSTSRNIMDSLVFFLCLNALGRPETFAEGAKAEEGSPKDKGPFRNSTGCCLMPLHMGKPLLDKEELSALGGWKDITEMELSHPL